MPVYTLSRRRALAALARSACACAAWGVTGRSRAQAISAETPLPKLGAPLALPDVPLLDGKVFRAADAKGQVTVLYWWASWCPFCAVQSPLMDKLWQAHKARGLRVLGLSIDKQASDAAGYLVRKGYTFPAAMFTAELAGSLPKPKGLPVTLVRGRDERIVMAEAGQLFPEDIEQIARFL